MLARLGESVAALLADGIASSFVLIVRGDVADGGVQPDGVVLGPDVVQLGVELTGVADLLRASTSTASSDPAAAISSGARPVALPSRAIGVTATSTSFRPMLSMLTPVRCPHQSPGLLSSGSEGAGDGPHVSAVPSGI